MTSSKIPRRALPTPVLLSHCLTEKVGSLKVPQSTKDPRW